MLPSWAPLLERRQYPDAWDSEGLLINLRSLVWGLVVTQVLGSKWRARFRRLFQFWGLDRFFPWELVHDWQREARCLMTRS